MFISDLIGTEKWKDKVDCWCTIVYSLFSLQKKNKQTNNLCYIKSLLWKFQSGGDSIVVTVNSSWFFTYPSCQFYITQKPIFLIAVVVYLFYVWWYFFLKFYHTLSACRLFLAGRAVNLPRTVKTFVKNSGLKRCLSERNGVERLPMVRTDLSVNSSSNQC